MRRIPHDDINQDRRQITPGSRRYLCNIILTLKKQNYEKKEECVHVVIDLNIHFDAAEWQQSTVTTPTEKLFSRITQEAYDKGRAQEVEDELRSACVSAPKLVKALNTNDALGYTDTKNLNSSDLYDMLDEHFKLTFKRDNFRKYRSK